MVGLSRAMAIRGRGRHDRKP